MDLKKLRKENKELVDHIQAIVNDGDIWDESNLQVLCTECHKEKTRNDLKIASENGKLKRKQPVEG